eukprot:222945-Pleurochrysis_carterae.AAC.1
MLKLPSHIPKLSNLWRQRAAFAEPDLPISAKRARTSSAHTDMHLCVLVLYISVLNFPYTSVGSASRMHMQVSLLSVLSPARASLPPDRSHAFALQKTRVQIWIFENTDLRIEGRIVVRPIYRASSADTVSLSVGPVPACQRTLLLTAAAACLPSMPKALELSAQECGFDEYMNLVLDDAEELSIKKKTRKTLGKPTSHDARAHT